ncbi:Alpha/Beta hydrolase protein [Leptodontidium sp. 2 PMI_412]|nr:Alpha/Beta hydrolase protein [Leptodontidium sp. 2 PMI_412]
MYRPISPLPQLQTAKTQFVTTKDGIKLAYRLLGPSSGVSLLFLHHFRGTIDHWDPLLIHSIASHRPVIPFDNVGIGHSTGTVDDSVSKMAAHAIEFLSLLKITQVDIIGFSLGGVVAPLVALNGPPDLARKLILTGTTSTYGPDLIQSMTDEGVLKYAAAQDLTLESIQYLFFKLTKTSEAAGRAWWDRIHERTRETSGEERVSYVSDGFTDGGAGMMDLITAMQAAGDPANAAEGSYDRLGDIKIPVLVANGYENVIVPTINSFYTSQKIPGAYLLVYPDAGHGILFQYAEQFAKQVNGFLDGW